MQTMREAWTDERLDDLNERVSEGFRRMDEQFARIDARFERLEHRIDDRFAAMQRTMVQTSGVIVAALIGVIATQL